jgi:hypothetical protein
MSNSRIDVLKDEILANTIKRNTKRPLNLLDIAQKIIELKTLLGSLKAVSEMVKISESTLNKFLSVFKLSPEVQEFVKSRKMDSIEIAYNLKSLTHSDQYKIAKLISLGKLDSHDVRTIVPFRKRKMSEDLDLLITRIIESKNKKIYTAYIEVKKESSPKKINLLLKKRFEPDHIHAVSIENDILKLTFSANGYKKLKKNSKNNNSTIKKFLNELING